MLNSMLKIFVGPVMGGLNPHQPPVNTPLVFTVGKKPLSSPTLCVERRWNLRRKVRSIDGSIDRDAEEEADRRQ
jgi:hypothetical protein